MRERSVSFSLLFLGLCLPGVACRARQLPAPPPAADRIAAPAGASRHDGGAAPRVVVVGGGLAGLVSAYELGKLGMATVLLEASDSWGGRVATAYYGNETYAEYGMQEMWASNPLLRIARELSVPLDQKVERPYSSVVLDGKLFPYVQPTAEKFFASFLDRRERAALAAWMADAKALRVRAAAATSTSTAAAGGAALTPELESLQAQSFADWVAAAKLPKRPAEWLRLTLECELGTDWRSFSALAGLLELGAFLGEGEANYHVRGGNVRLVDALVAAIPGEKTLSATVTAVERWQDAGGHTRARVSYLRNRRLETVEAERVILAVPWIRLHQIRFDPPLSDEKWQAVLTLGRGQYTVVHLLVDKRGRAIWAPRGGPSPFPVLTDGPLGVVYGVMHPSPDGEPLEVFSLLVHGAAAAAFHMIPREVKLREILAALERLWPGLGAHVRSSQVFTYHPAAIPVWPPGRSPLDPPARALRAPEMGLVLAGDYTLSAHSDGAAQSAEAAVAWIGKELTTPPTLGAAPPRAVPAPPPAEGRAP